MNRKKNVLIPFEKSILFFASKYNCEFYGYQLAKDMDIKKSTKVGTMYRALNRLVKMGYLSVRWEEPREAEKRSSLHSPQRKLYRLA